MGQSPGQNGRHPDSCQEQELTFIDCLQTEAAGAPVGATIDQPQRKAQKYHITRADHSSNPSPVPGGWLNSTAMPDTTQSH